MTVITNDNVSLSKLSFLLCMGHLFTKGSLLILTSSCQICLLTEWFEERCKPTKWIKKKVMGLVGFEGPLRGEKKQLEQESLDSVLKSIST